MRPSPAPFEPKLACERTCRRPDSPEPAVSKAAQNAPLVLRNRPLVVIRYNLRRSARSQRRNAIVRLLGVVSARRRRPSLVQSVESPVSGSVPGGGLHVTRLGHFDLLRSLFDRRGAGLPQLRGRTDATDCGVGGRDAPLCAQHARRSPRRLLARRCGPAALVARGARRAAACRAARAEWGRSLGREPARRLVECRCAREWASARDDPGRR